MKPANPAGFTFFGQFIDHDLTEFRVVGENLSLIPQNPTIGQRQRVLEDGEPTSTNGRIPTLDLDCVYGLLGVVEPDLFHADGQFRMRADQKDILRDPRLYRNGRLIADPRNDENKIVVQIHILFERLHNQIHSSKPGSAAEKAPGGRAFEETRRTVQNVYRRIVLHDYLPRIVQEPHINAVLDKLERGETFYQAMNRRARAAFRQAFPRYETLGLEREVQPEGLIAMPVEFAHAVFRLGAHAASVRLCHECRPRLSAVRLGHGSAR
ncbi:hypothetical protein CH341_26905 [Rhodoplanes roseus]|uniref:Heme peroxidase n=1 Tax=Rhodoplanes roseus TaxID=29409 RepID=A0A327KJN0_9BRAD|nr:hypothetical protein CH341_26905 [Rhodoplanes roseus]